MHLPAETTGNVRISMSAMKWDLLVKDYHREKFEAVVTLGEVMIGSTTMNVTTLFFDKEKPSFDKNEGVKVALAETEG